MTSETSGPVEPGGTAPDSPPPPAPGRLRAIGAWLGKRTPTQIATTAGLALVVGLSVFGGLEPAQADDLIDGDLAQAELGETLDAAPFEVTIERAVWVANDLPGVYAEVGSSRWIAVIGTIRNTDDITSYITRQALVVSGAEGLDPAGTKQQEDGVAPSSVLVMADTSTLDAAQPGLTYEVAFMVEQSGDVDPAEGIDVTFMKHTERLDSFSQYLAWRDPEPFATLHVPVTEAVDTTGE